MRCLFSSCLIWMCSSILTPGGGGTGTAKIKTTQKHQGRRRGQTRDNMETVNDEHEKATQVSGAHKHTHKHNDDGQVVTKTIYIYIF